VSQGMPISTGMTSNSPLSASAPSITIPSRSAGTPPAPYVIARHTDQVGHKSAWPRTRMHHPSSPERTWGFAVALVVMGAWSAMPMSDTAADKRSHARSVPRLVRTMEAAPRMERSSGTIAQERVCRLNIGLARYEATVGSELGRLPSAVAKRGRASSAKLFIASPSSTDAQPGQSVDVDIHSRYHGCFGPR
jgi:hypothetical protein